MTYDKAHFLAKFSATTDDQWCVGEFESADGRHCAAGLCGARMNRNVQMVPEADALYNLFGQYPVDGESPNCYLPLINDGRDPRYQQPTPKARILAALNDLP